MEKTNWFTGCDTFEELTEAFRAEKDNKVYNNVRDAFIGNLKLINQYIMILESNYDIKRKGN